MTSRNNAVFQPVPSAGVHYEMDTRRMPPEALASSLNVYVKTGYLRPRPSHEKLAVVHKWRGDTAIAGFSAIGRRRRDLWIIGHTSGVVYTSENGRNDFESHNLSGAKIVLVGNIERTGIWIAMDVDGRVFRADPLWPSDASTGWVTLGDIIPPSPYAYEISTYDSYGRVLIVLDGGAGEDQVRVLWNTDTLTPPFTFGTDWKGLQPSPQPAAGTMQDCTVATDTSGNEYWIICGSNGKIYRTLSDDNPAGPWTIIDVTTNPIVSVAAIGRLIVAAATVASPTGTEIWVSNDAGSTWSLATTLSGVSATMVRAGSSEWMLMGSNYLSSASIADYSTWTQRTVPSANDMVAAHHDKAGSWLAVDSAAAYYHSDLEALITGIYQPEKAGPIYMSTSSGWLRWDHATNETQDVSSTGYTLSGNKERAVDRTVWRRFAQGSSHFVIGVNGVDRPVVLEDGKEYMRYMYGDPPAAQAIAIAAGRVVLGNLRSGLNVSPYAIDMSDVNTFDSGWGNVLVALLDHTPGEIVAMLEESNLQILILKSDAIYRAVAQAEFYGQLAPFRFEPVAIDTQGPCSRHSIIRLPDRTIVYLARDGSVRVFDSTSPRDAGAHIREVIQPDFDETRPDECWGFYDPWEDLIWFWYKNITGARRGIIVDVGSPGWPVWPVTLPFDAVVAGRPWLADELLIGDLTMPIGEIRSRIGDLVDLTPSGIIVSEPGNIYRQLYEASDYTDDGSPILIQWRTGLHALGAEAHFKTMNEYEHRLEIEAGESLTTTITAEDRPGTERSKPLTDTTSTKLTHGVSLSGRRFQVDVAGTISKLFRWFGADVFLAMKGRR